MDIAIDYEMDEEALEEPLLEEEMREPYEPSRSDLMYSKMNYFRRLQQLSPQKKPMSPPTHILPPSVLLKDVNNDRHSIALHSIPEKNYQSSWSTIFSIWNTMIGSTLVALPYGFSCSGLLLGIGIVITMGAICCYTCNLVVTHGQNFTDFGSLSQYYFGQRAQLFIMATSLFVLTGACIAYHVLMTECSYAVFTAIFQWTNRTDILAHWTPSTAAFLVLLLFPLTNLKKFSVLVLINSFGIPFVLYTIYFIVSQGIDKLEHAKDPLADIVITGKSSFGILGGIVTLSFFIHNAIQPIVLYSNPATRSRDITTAYVLVGLSYTVVGALGYIGFPQGHHQQNFLDAFPILDTFAFSARASLLFQLATVYPLVLLIVRTQFFGLVFNTPWPSALAVVLLNATVMTVTTLFAVYYPKVGDVLRFTGAIGGFILIFCVPIGIHLLVLRAKHLVTKTSITFHCLLIWMGLAVLLLHMIRATTPNNDGDVDNTQLSNECKVLARKAIAATKAGKHLDAVKHLEAACEIEQDNWILWKYFALAQFELWQSIVVAPATLSALVFLRSQGFEAPKRSLMNAYDAFVVAMEYPENKHNATMLHKIAILYMEHRAYQGALTVCTMLLETCRHYAHMNEAVFVTASAAAMLQHPNQSGDYFAHLTDKPPHNLRKYQLFLLAGMQFDADTTTPESSDRARILYEEGYKSLVNEDCRRTPSEKTAMNLFRSSRKNESERIQLWTQDAAVWEELAVALFNANHPAIAKLALDYAVSRQGIATEQLLLLHGRVLYRIGNLEDAQRVLERGLYENYYTSPCIRFWLSLVSPAWASYLNTEERGAVTVQRIYRGHLGRNRALRFRHARSERLKMKVFLLGRMHWKTLAAQTRVATRKALELEREANERVVMDLNDDYLRLQRWNAAAVKIQMLYHILLAKKEKARRIELMAKHQRLLERVLRHTNEQWLRACFDALSQYVCIHQEEKGAAVVVLQRNVRRFLSWRHFQQLKAKEAAQRQLVGLFLGHRDKQRQQSVLNAWRLAHAHAKAVRRKSCIRIQSWYRGLVARWSFRAALQRQCHIRDSMQAFILGRQAHSMYKCLQGWKIFTTAIMYHKNKMAIVIQRRLRGIFARRKAKKLHGRRLYCERMVQSMRRKRNRRTLDETWTMWQLYLEIYAMELNHAATTIQRVFRGAQSRKHVRFERDYQQIYYPTAVQKMPLVLVSLRLVFLAWKTARRYRFEVSTKAARVLQRFYRHSKHQRQGRSMLRKLKKQHALLLKLQRSFYGVASAFFRVLKELRTCTIHKRNQAAMVLQRNLRGWLARKVFRRLARQQKQSKALMMRVIYQRSRQLMVFVVENWKTFLAEAQEQKLMAIIKIQRRYRAMHAMRNAKVIVEKKARQLRLLEHAAQKPLSRSFHQWASILISKALESMETMATSPLLKMKEWSRLTIDKDDGGLNVPSMLYFHVLTRVRNTGHCHLPPGHGFNCSQLRQLFSLASSVIVDGNACGFDLVDALYLCNPCPVQKLILYNQTPVDLIKLSRCIEFPSHQLRSLVLGGTTISTKQLLSLGLALEHPHCKLQQLVLESCGIGNGGGAVLARALCTNRSLWKVDLSSNHLSDAVCKHWVPVLIKNGVLKILCLNKNMISDNGVLCALVPALMNLPNTSALESIQLQANARVSSRSADEIQATLERINRERAVMLCVDV